MTKDYRDFLEKEKVDEVERHFYDDLSDRDIQIKILKAAERIGRYVAFFFWLSLILILFGALV